MPAPSHFHGRLAGQVAIVTGAGSQGEGFGCGKAIAWIFAREGASVLLVDIDEGRARETQGLIEAEGGRALVASGDVTSEKDAARMVAECADAFGGCDILVNNVGVGAGGARLDGVVEQEWRRSIDLNFASAFQMTRAAMPLLLQSRGKAIVNIASVAGWRAHGSAGYGPAKAALMQFTRECAMMYGRDGIRVNTVVPGHLMTPMVERFLPAEAREVRRGIAPLGTEGDAFDIAQAALFLAGPESRFVTGIDLPVDGGVSSIGPLAAYEMVTGRLATPR